MSNWPSSNDYTAAIQSPQICFRDPDLNTALVEKNKLTRMSKVWTGNFAQVYELRNSTKKWAVKCFTRSAADIRLRYSELSKAITGSRLPYFVEFRFIDDEMLVNGKRYPIVKMQWVDGESLDKHIEGNLYRPQVLLDTAGKLLTMVKELEAHQLAHGDLQHGNVVITSVGLRWSTTTECSCRRLADDLRRRTAFRHISTLDADRPTSQLALIASRYWSYAPGSAR